MADFKDKSKRLRERVKLALPVRVQCRESAEHEWVEMSRLIDVTPFGARFVLTHPTERGRLRKFLERLGTAWYGYGWRSYDYAGHRIIGHRGGIRGYRSLILFDPVKKSGVVALWNNSEE